MTLLTKLYALVGIVAAIFLFGALEHHKGFEECKADYDKEKIILEKESQDAIKKEQDQADSDKQLIADYYGRMLSARPKLPSRSIQTQSASGVLPTSCQCTITEENLRFEQNCAEDAAKLVRVTKWLKSVDIKPQ